MFKGDMFRRYVVRFFFRLMVFAAVAAVYLTCREALDFTKCFRTGGMWLPVCVLWLILLVSFVLQLSPKSKVHRGCLKQFREKFIETGTKAGDICIKDKIAKLNRGAAKVAVVWGIPNILIAAAFYAGLIGVPEMLLLAAFYYLCDVICILFFCPFQTFLMKNRCCVSCRIFAWGPIMICTPLIFIPHVYSWSITAVALFCLTRWEMTLRRHPERFLEETNAYLRCGNCAEHMCRIKKAKKLDS